MARAKILWLLSALVVVLATVTVNPNSDSVAIGSTLDLTIAVSSDDRLADFYPDLLLMYLFSTNASLQSCEQDWGIQDSKHIAVVWGNEIGERTWAAQILSVASPDWNANEKDPFLFLCFVANSRVVARSANRIKITTEGFSVKITGVSRRSDSLTQVNVNWTVPDYVKGACAVGIEQSVAGSSSSFDTSEKKSGEYVGWCRPPSLSWIPDLPLTAYIKCDDISRVHIVEETIPGCPRVNATIA